MVKRLVLGLWGGHPRAFGLAAAIAGLLIAVPLANAVGVVINDTDLSGGGGTTWDPESTDYACTDPGDTAPQFTPVVQGETASPARDDGFDGAFVVWVNGLGGQMFGDADGNGNLKGNSLSAGPTPTGGLKVSQTETALQTSPTLRMLYKFTNSTSHKVRKTIALETNLGSDDETTADASSNGNTSWTTADRWLVTHEEPFDADADPVVSQVWYGKHAREPVVAIERSDTDCFLSKFRIALKGHKTRYLMFFAQMNAAGVGNAVRKVQTFEDRGLNRKLLSGLNRKVKRKILNWDL
jgi:hypothetical protein